MDKQISDELVSAANIMMAAPNLVTQDQRRSAENVFLNFRKTKSPYNLCRQLLEQCDHDYVKFEAAETIKGALIREWRFLDDSDIVVLRSYLMNYVCSNKLASFVQERLLQVIAIMVKRASIDDLGIERSSIMQEIEALILNCDTTQQILGCRLILNIMQEYGNTANSTDVGLPFMRHVKAKVEFEIHALQRIFQFCINVLSELMKNDSPYPPNIALLLQNILNVAESVLTWNSAMRFSSAIRMIESARGVEKTTNLQLSASWRELMISPMLLPLMFQVYWKVRDLPELSQNAMTCLVQLSSVNGACLKDNELKYLTLYLENFLKLVTSFTIKANEVIGISTIILNIQLIYKQEFMNLSREILASYVDEITRLTCLFIEGANVDERVRNDNYICAFTTIFEAWTVVIGEYRGQVDVFKPSAVQIFNTYLQYHLAPPDGRRARSDDEVEEDEDNDRIKYQDHLQAIGLLGRNVLEHSLPLLSKLLENRIGQLAQRLQAMYQQAMTYDDSVQLENLFEDIHWLVLIAGHTLCMDSVGETPLIPYEVMRHSAVSFDKGESDLDSTLKTMASVRQPDLAADCVQKCDPAIRIFANVLNLCAMESRAHENNLGAFMSPEVGCTLMWFLKRWCLSYLLPMEDYYDELSLPLIRALGKDTEGATFAINFLLEKIQSNLYCCKDEAVLLRDTVEIFADMVAVKDKAVHIVKMEGLWNLIKLQMNIPPGVLPPNVRRGLYKGFVLVCAGLSEADEQADYCKQVLKPVEQRLKSILCQENFNRVYHEETIKIELIDIIEKLVGVSKGTTPATARLVFDFLVPILSELPTLLALYHNYRVIVQLILELFGQCAQNILCYLDGPKSHRIYECTYHAVETYSKYNVNRFSNDASDEEDNLEDLSLLVDLLSSVLSNNWLKIGTLSLNEDDLSASDVALYGLQFLMPLMTVDLLKYPKLCLQYYRLLILFSDIYPRKVATLDDQMLKSILASVELGITKFTSDVVQICLDFIATMTLFVHENQMHGTKLYELLLPFLNLVMDMALSQQINSDSTTSLSSCVFSLITCFSDQYQMLVQGLINQQTEEMVANRLIEEFNRLAQHTNKRFFSKEFDKFMANVHGLLLIK